MLGKDRKLSKEIFFKFFKKFKKIKKNFEKFLKKF